MRISLSVAGDVQIDRTLVRFADRTDDMSGVLGALADDFAKVEARQFAGQGTYSGGWAPLSAGYAARKAVRYPGKGILEAEGRLMRSLTGSDGPDAVREVTRDSLLVGTSVPYAGYHQRGTSRMPQRRPVELSAGTRRRWVQTIQRYFVSGVVDTGGDE